MRASDESLMNTSAAFNVESEAASFEIEGEKTGTKLEFGGSGFSSAVALRESQLSIPPSSEQSAGILRGSVSAMEVSSKQRRKAKLLFALLTVGLVFITPLYVIKSLGLIPSFPEISALKTSLDAYYTYLKVTNKLIAAQIHGNYTLAVEAQTAECNAFTSLAYSELSRVPTKSSEWANLYCTDVVRRLSQVWNASSIPKFAAGANCASLSQKDSNIGNFVIWTTIADQKDSYGNNNRRQANGNSSRSLFGAFFQSPDPYPSRCGNNNFDEFRYPIISILNGIRCEYYQTAMQRNVSTNNGSSAGFVTSAKSYTSYNDKFGIALMSKAATLKNAATSIRAAWSTSVNSANAFNNQLKTGVSNMRDGYNSFKSTYDSLSVLSDLGGIEMISSPNLDIPSYPNQALYNLKDVADKMDNYSTLFSTYNPPSVNWPSTEIQANLSVPSNITLSVSSLSLRDSILVKEIYVAFELLQTFLDNFLWYDLSLRICLWFQNLSVLLLEPRRNFILAQTRVKDCVGFLLRYLSLVAYFIVFIILIAIVASFTYSPTLVIDELTVMCNNQVLVENDATLTSYKNELASRRYSCNNSLSQLNSQIELYNKIYIDMLNTYSKNYETFYNATAMDSASSSAFSGVNQISNMYLPNPSLPTRGMLASYQKPVPFDSYNISSYPCSGAAEFIAVSQEIQYTVKLLGNYLLSLLMIGIGTIIAFKFLTIGLQKWFYLELTTGYIMEMEIRSNMLKARVHWNKLQAVGLWIFSTLLFVLDIAIWSSIVKNTSIV